MKYETTIPFQGFYDSDWDAEIDMVIEDLAEYLAETHTGDMMAAIYEHADFKSLRQRIAKQYAEQFAHAIGLPLTYVEMDSPKEYNFTTDRLFMAGTRALWRKLRKEVLSGDLHNHATERHTSRSGFISFYSPDTSTWGHVDTWDLNQRGTLLRAWLETKGFDAKEIEADCLETMRCNGAFQIDLDEGKLA